MNELARRGRNFTVRIFPSMILIPLYTIIMYNIAADGVETKKLIQQIVRFCLTVVLMLYVFKGKVWAIQLMTILFSLAMVFAVVALFKPVGFIAKIPIIIMIIIYSLGFYHFRYARSFREYVAYLGSIR